MGSELAKAEQIFGKCTYQVLVSASGKEFCGIYILIFKLINTIFTNKKTQQL